MTDKEYSPLPNSPRGDKYSGLYVAGVPNFSPHDSISSIDSQIQPSPPNISLCNFPVSTFPSADFKVMEVQPLILDEQKCHDITFYQSTLTLFAKQTKNNAIMDQVQYCCPFEWWRESFFSLYEWIYKHSQAEQKYSIMLCSDDKGSFVIG
jgi:hypothetical protein